MEKGVKPMRARKAVMAAILLGIVLTAVAGAAEATLERMSADPANRAAYFRYEGRGERFVFSTASPAIVQGVAVNVPVPDGVDVSRAREADIDFFYFKVDGVTVLECSFRPEVEKARDGGEPMNSNRRVLAQIAEDNLSIRETARNTNDGKKLAETPIITYAQNTDVSAILEARNPVGEKWGAPSLFEGYVVVDGVCIPVAANGHVSPSGIDTGELYMAWLNELLEASGL